MKTSLLMTIAAVLAFSGAATAAQAETPRRTAPPAASSAQTEPASEPAVSRRLIQDDEEPGPGTRLDWVPGASEARFGAFRRPEHLRGERPDYMRSSSKAVGLAISFRLGS